MSAIFEQAFYPWLVFIQVLPKVALGPLLVVWFGVGFLPKALVSFLLAFFPIMIDTLVGLKSVQRDYVFLLRSMGASPLKRFLLFQLPYALPHIFASLKVAITLAVVGAIVGEFIGADKGLGYVLIVATGTLDTVLIFVALVWISALVAVALRPGLCCSNASSSPGTLLRVIARSETPHERKRRLWRRGMLRSPGRCGIGKLSSMRRRDARRAPRIQPAL